MTQSSEKSAGVAGGLKSGAYMPKGGSSGPQPMHGGALQRVPSRPRSGASRAGGPALRRRPPSRLRWLRPGSDSTTSGDTALPLARRIRACGSTWHLPGRGSVRRWSRAERGALRAHVDCQHLPAADRYSSGHARHRSPAVPAGGWWSDISMPIPNRVHVPVRELNCSVPAAGDRLRRRRPTDWYSSISASNVSSLANHVAVFLLAGCNFFSIATTSACTGGSELFVLVTARAVSLFSSPWGSFTPSPLKTGRRVPTPGPCR